MILAALKKVKRALRKSLADAKSLQERFPQFEIGTGSYGNIKVKTFRADDVLSIGKYCSFADEVHILLSGEHRADWITTFPFPALDKRFADIEGHPRTKGPVVIGHDVWVGYRATILSGVTIGHGAIVGAGSVVAKDIPPYGIVAGNPAKLIGRRFGDHECSQLLQIRWWDWPQSEIDNAMLDLLNTDTSAFLRKHAERLSR